MKKICIAAGLALMAAASALTQQQKITVVLAPFNTTAGVPQSDVNVIAQIMGNRLARTQAVTVVQRDRLDAIMREHQFQTSDWSDKKKTAELGQAANADWVITGGIKKVGSRLIILIEPLDVKTLVIKGGADAELASIEEAYDKMPSVIEELVSTMTGGTGSATLPRTAQPAARPGAAPAIGIQVTVGVTGTLYVNEKEENVLWNNDIYIITIDKPGTYELKFVTSDGKTAEQSVTIKNRGIQNVNFFYISPEEAAKLAAAAKAAEAARAARLKAAPAPIARNLLNLPGGTFIAIKINKHQ